MRGTVPLKLYIYAFARRRKGSLGNLLISGKRPTDLYSSLWPWLTKPSEGASGHPVRMPSCRYNDWIKNLYKLKSRVYPSGNYVDHQRREASTHVTYQKLNTLEKYTSDTLLPTIQINLGTTYSCTKVWQHDRVEIIANNQGNETTPSYITFTYTKCLIGDAAENQVATNPINTVFNAKHLIGRRFTDSSV